MHVLLMLRTENISFCMPDHVLFDQNISFRVVNQLSDCFPECKHVSDVGLMGSKDSDIWTFARKNSYVVTFDSDFYEISLMNGIPPKIIWLKTGNLMSKEIIALLKMNTEIILEFINNPQFKDSACLIIENGI